MTHLCFLSLESKAESNQTQCYLGYKNNLLVYKVDSSLKVDPPIAVRIIAVERQSTAEVEVQVWKTVEGTVTTAGKLKVQCVGFRRPYLQQLVQRIGNILNHFLVGS